MFVAWNMGEWREFAQLRQFRLPDLYLPDFKPLTRGTSEP